MCFFYRNYLLLVTSLQESNIDIPNPRNKHILIYLAVFFHSFVTGYYMGKMQTTCVCVQLGPPNLPHTLHFATLAQL